MTIASAAKNVPEENAWMLVRESAVPAKRPMHTQQITNAIVNAKAPLAATVMNAETKRLRMNA